MGPLHRYLCFLDILMPTYNESDCTLLIKDGGMNMWVKPDFKIVEICAEVTAYAYRK